MHNTTRLEMLHTSVSFKNRFGGSEKAGNSSIVLTKSKRYILLSISLHILSVETSRHFILNEIAGSYLGIIAIQTLNKAAYRF